MRNPHTFNFYLAAAFTFLFLIAGTALILIGANAMPDNAPATLAVLLSPAGLACVAGFATMLCTIPALCLAAHHDTKREQYRLTHTLSNPFRTRAVIMRRAGRNVYPT